MYDRADVPTRVVFGTRVPDLKRIPREHWRAALAPFGPYARHVAASDLYLPPADRTAALALVATLAPAASIEDRRAIQAASSVPFDTAVRAQAPSRQLNLRLDGRSHENLLVASRILGVKPTQLARMLINAGVRRLLAEHDIAMDEAGRAGTLEA